MSVRVAYWRFLISNKSQLFPFFYAHGYKDLEDIINLLTVDIKCKYTGLPNLWKIFLLKCDSIKVQCYKWTPVNYCGEEVLRRIKNVVALVEEFKPWDGNEWANVNNEESYYSCSFRSSRGRSSPFSYCTLHVLFCQC